MTSEIILKYDGIPSISFHYIKYVRKDKGDQPFDNKDGFSCWAGGCGICQPLPNIEAAKEFIAKRIEKHLKIKRDELDKQLKEIVDVLSKIKGLKKEVGYGWLNDFRVEQFNHEVK